MKQGIVLICFFAVTARLGAQAQWHTLSDFPGTARDDASGIVCQGAGYMGTGFGTGFIYLADWWKYNFETDTWTPKTDLPAQPRQYTAITTMDEYIYLLGGITPAGCSDELWQYDVTSDSWTLVTHFPGGGRQAPVLCAVNGKLYAGLGRCGGTYYNDWWQFNPKTITWTALTSFPAEARFDPFNAVTNESIVVGAGVSASGAKNDVYRYDPVFNLWDTVADFPGCGVFYTVQACYGNELFVISGAGADYELCPGYYRYKNGYFNNTWTNWDVNELNPARRGGTGFLYYDRFYYVGGLDSGNNRLNRVEYINLENTNAGKGENEWIIYPTLTNDFVCIESSLQFNGSLSLFNTAGQPVSIDLPSVFHHYARLDVSALLPGLYLLQITDQAGQKVEIKKFVRL